MPRRSRRCELGSVRRSQRRSQQIGPSSSKSPRALGESTICGRPKGVPHEPRKIGAILEVSPRARGCTLRQPLAVPVTRGFPARAGMHPDTIGATGPDTGFPRARGDAPASYRASAGRAMVSPRARGCTLLTDKLAEIAAGFPARAGMHPLGVRHRTGHHGFPRARGDAPAHVLTATSLKVSPRARGCTLHQRGAAARPAGFPARAGMHP